MKPRESGLKRPAEILLVEDNAGDVRLTLEMLKDSRVRSHITVASDGVEALAVLKRTGKHAAATRPDLILLDLNLPKMSGHEVLTRVKADPDLKRIPIVVLSGSRAREDIVRAYDLHANCYVAKPLELERFNHTLENIQEFWFVIVKLPAE